MRNEIAITVNRDSNIHRHSAIVIHLYKKKTALVFIHTRRIVQVCLVTQHTQVRPAKLSSVVPVPFKINKPNRLSKNLHPIRRLLLELVPQAIGVKRLPLKLSHVKPRNEC